MRRAALLLALLGAGCVSPLEQGERLYRQGDRRAALETWRGIPPQHRDRTRAETRIRDVEAEFEQLVEQYRQQAAYFESEGRLAESVLSYRLAHTLQPDRETLEKVQVLARRLVELEARHQKEYRTAFDRGQLATARRHLARLRQLDPLDPDLPTHEEELARAFDAEVDRHLARGRRGFFAADYATAEAAFRQVLRLDPGNEAAQGYLAYIDTVRDSSRGRPPAVVEPPRFRATDAEIRAEGFYQNALSAERAGDPYTAIRYDLAALAANPSHRGAREHMATLRRRLRPQVDALIESGSTAFAREDLHTALDRWRRALLIQPGNRTARDYVERAEKLLANLERLRAEPPDGER